MYSRANISKFTECKLSSVAFYDQSDLKRIYWEVERFVYQTINRGYIQRRLVKALEDVSVKYDNTVRNSRGLIIQFLYGEDAIDATYMENLHLKLLNYNSSELEKIYYNKNLPEEFEMIKCLQKDLIEISSKRDLNNAKLNDDYYPMPVNIGRILSFARNIDINSNDKYTDKEIFNEVLNLANRLSLIFVPYNGNIEGSERFRSSNATNLFRIYMHSELATMKIKDLNKQQFIYVIQDIELKFRRAIVNAGEMCGILAAQSIGELTTQLTLNSVDYNTIMVINWTGENIPPCRPNEKIGKFIDALIEKYSNDCQLQQDGHTIYLPLEKGTAKALSVDENGNMMWTELIAVTKHLPVNKDGTNTLVKITTNFGREAICTKGKSFLVYKNGKIVEKEGYDLMIGDLIPIVNKMPTDHVKSYININNILNVDEYCDKNTLYRINPIIKMDFHFGYLIGTYLSEGFSNRYFNYSNNYNLHTILNEVIKITCGVNVYNKKMPEFVYNAPTLFIEGIYDGYFNKYCYLLDKDPLVISFISKDLRDGFSLLYKRFNIHTKLSETGTFNKIIYKLEIINNIQNGLYNDIILERVIKIEEICPTTKYVYDLTVDKTCNMCVLNGVNLRDTFHSAGISAKNITLGVPRLKELINVTKKLKSSSLTMYEKNLVKDLNPTAQKRIIESIRSSLEYKILQDIIKSSDIVYSDDEEYSNDFEIISVYKTLYKYTEYPIPDKFLSLRLEFTSKDIEYADTSLLEISKLLETSIANGHKIICSDDNTEVNGKENLFIRIICADASNDNQKEQMSILRKIEISCMSIKVKGCEGIERVYTREAKLNKWDPEKGHYKEPQWILETEGTNLLGSMENPHIDHTKTISNNIIEIYEIFGIEAARQALLNELRTVLSFDGSYVNYRHLSLLVDTMTCRGALTSMTRHGINRLDNGVLTKASFEETVEVLTDAAAFGEIDNLRGISDNIMLGQTIPAGTGVMDILYDTEMEPDLKIPAISREPTPMLADIITYIPSEPEYDPLSAWPY